MDFLVYGATSGTANRGTLGYYYYLLLRGAPPWIERHFKRPWRRDYIISPFSFPFHLDDRRLFYLFVCLFLFRIPEDIYMIVDFRDIL